MSFFSLGCRDTSNLIFTEHVEGTATFKHLALIYLDAIVYKTVYLIETKAIFLNIAVLKKEF